MCQYRPSASVHSCARIIWDGETRGRQRRVPSLCQPASSPRHRPGSAASASRRGACRSRSARPGRSRSGQPAARCRRRTGNTAGASSSLDPPGWQTRLCLHRRSAGHTGRGGGAEAVESGRNTRPPGRERRPQHLLADGSRHGYREGPDGAPPQVLPFPLLTELAQLLLLLLVQGVAVLGLEPEKDGDSGGRVEV